MQPFLDLSLIEQRLVAQVAALKKVAGASDLSSAIEDLKGALPTAYVIPTRDNAGPNIVANAVSQQVTGGFGIIFAVRNLRDQRGEKAQVDLVPLRSAAADALLNWPPAADYMPCEFAGGRLLRLTDSVLYWIDEYRTRFEVRKT